MELPLRSLQVQRPSQSPRCMRMSHHHTSHLSQTPTKQRLVTYACRIVFLNVAHQVSRSHDICSSCSVWCYLTSIMQQSTSLAYKMTRLDRMSQNTKWSYACMCCDHGHHHTLQHPVTALSFVNQRNASRLQCCVIKQVSRSAWNAAGHKVKASAIAVDRVPITQACCA